MNRKELYPLKFYPRYYEKIWGGDELSKLIDDDKIPPKCGEVWLLSEVEGTVSIVANGRYKNYPFDRLIDEMREDLLGKEVYEKYKSFPLLIKIIDAKEKLSVQVHPDDDLAKLRHNSYGKNEMWYIIKSKDDSWLVLGFNDKLSKDDYVRYVNKGTLESKLHREKISNDEVYYIPAGLVHAIGNNILLAEIQQSSDITYRIFDWNRVGEDGKSRELHTEKALDAIKYMQPYDCKIRYDDVKNVPIRLVDNEFFKTKKLLVDKEMKLDKGNNFVVYLCIGGNGSFIVDGYREEIAAYELIMIPAKSEDILIVPNYRMTLLEVTV